MTLIPILPEMPHPTRKDFDGGAAMIDGTRNSRFERAQLRQFCESWTPEKIAKLEADNAKHKAWLASDAGKVFLGRLSKGSAC